MVACLAFAALAVGAALVIARDLGHKVDQNSARGRHAIAVAHGSAQNPNALFARVRSRPKQRIHGDYDVVCHKGGQSSEKTGRFSGRTTHVERLPHAYANPSSCSAGISAQLKHHGRIIVQLWARP